MAQFFGFEQHGPPPAQLNQPLAAPLVENLGDGFAVSADTLRQFLVGARHLDRADTSTEPTPGMSASRCSVSIKRRPNVSTTRLEMRRSLSSVCFTS